MAVTRETRSLIVPPTWIAEPSICTTFKMFGWPGDPHNDSIASQVALVWLGGQWNPHHVQGRDESQPLKLEICAPYFKKWGRLKGQCTKGVTDLTNTKYRF